MTKKNMQWVRSALLVALALAAASGWLSREAPRGTQPTGVETAAPAEASQWQPGDAALPPEARDTLRLIAADGPFPFDRDGTVFQNREGRLPPQPRGYYREYTVITPGSSDRGARRIVAGGDPPVEFHYTDDHYRSFRRIEAATR
jgi:guanyl-specific ribonuclease Sa